MHSLFVAIPIPQGLEWVAHNHEMPGIVHLSIEGGYSSIVNTALDQLIRNHNLHAVVSAGGGINNNSNSNNIIIIVIIAHRQQHNLHDHHQRHLSWLSSSSFPLYDIASLPLTQPRRLAAEFCMHNAGVLAMLPVYCKQEDQPPQPAQAAGCGASTLQATWAFRDLEAFPCSMRL